MRPAPNLAGFGDAMDQVRRSFGVDAEFWLTSDAVWPAGTQLDPETGRPYDPFVEPESGGATTLVSKRCSFVHRAIAAGGQAQATPLGSVDTGTAALIVAVEDYDDVRAARRVTVGEESWDITTWRYDTVFTHERYLAYLEHA